MIETVIDIMAEFRLLADGAREGGLEVLVYEYTVFAGSSNGRTTPFGGVCRGSNPLPAAIDS